MSDVLNGNALASDPNPVSTPTITHYQEIAAKVSSDLAAAVAQIPHFEARHETTEAFVRSHKGVKAEFIATAVAAVEATPELRAVNKFDVVAARDTLQFIEAFRPVVDQLDALAADVRFTIDARKATQAADALQIYDISKGLARDPRKRHARSARPQPAA